MPGAPVKDEERTSARWNVSLWSTFWIVWALRGISLFVDLGAAEPLIAVASWIAFGAVLIEMSLRRVRTGIGR